MATDRPRGGQLYTRRVTVNDTPTVLTSDPTDVPYRYGLEIIQDDTVDVFMGYSDVAATGSTKGIPLLGTPDTDPPTPPDRFPETISNQPVYGIAASGQTGHVIVAEWY